MKAVLHWHGKDAELQYDSPLGDMMAKCYASISEGKDTKVRIPIKLDAMFDQLEQALQINIQREYVTLALSAHETNRDMVMVAYSSGLDSTSHALYWKLQGKDVILFHVKHLNHSYPDEYKFALQFADDYDFPMVIIEPKWIKQTAYVDNPIKNQTILSYMIDYGRTIGCMDYGMGNYATDRLMDQIQGYWTTDSIELYDAFNDYVRSWLPDYQYHHMPFDKYGAFEFVVKAHACDNVNSCLRPHRFKDYTHDQTVMKYGVPLIPHHCGVCYKCALEYLMLTDLGYYDLNVPYAKKCIETLRKQDGTTFSMGIRKSMSDKEVLYTVLKRPITARWGPVIAKGIRRG